MGVKGYVGALEAEAWGNVANAGMNVVQSAGRDEAARKLLTAKDTSDVNRETFAINADLGMFMGDLQYDLEYGKYQEKIDAKFLDIAGGIADNPLLSKKAKNKLTSEVLVMAKDKASAEGYNLGQKSMMTSIDVDIDGLGDALAADTSSSLADTVGTYKSYLEELDVFTPATVAKRTEKYEYATAPMKALQAFGKAHTANHRGTEYDKAKEADKVILEFDLDDSQKGAFKTGVTKFMTKFETQLDSDAGEALKVLKGEVFEAIADKTLYSIKDIDEQISNALPRHRVDLYNARVVAQANNDELIEKEFHTSLGKGVPLTDEGWSTISEVSNTTVRGKLVTQGLLNLAGKEPNVAAALASIDNAPDLVTYEERRVAKLEVLKRHAEDEKFTVESVSAVIEEFQKGLPAAPYTNKPQAPAPVKVEETPESGDNPVEAIEEESAKESAKEPSKEPVEVVHAVGISLGLTRKESTELFVATTSDLMKTLSVPEAEAQQMAAEAVVLMSQEQEETTSAQPVENAGKAQEYVVKPINTEQTETERVRSILDNTKNGVPPTQEQLGMLEVSSLKKVTESIGQTLSKEPDVSDPTTLSQLKTIAMDPRMDQFHIESYAQVGVQSGNLTTVDATNASKRPSFINKDNYTTAFSLIDQITKTVVKSSKGLSSNIGPNIKTALLNAVAENPDLMDGEFESLKKQLTEVASDTTSKEYLKKIDKVSKAFDDKGLLSVFTTSNIVDLEKKIWDGEYDFLIDMKLQDDKNIRNATFNSQEELVDALSNSLYKTDYANLKINGTEKDFDLQKSTVMANAVFIQLKDRQLANAKSTLGFTPKSVERIGNHWAFEDSEVPGLFYYQTTQGGEAGGREGAYWMSTTLTKVDGVYSSSSNPQPFIDAITSGIEDESARLESRIAYHTDMLGRYSGLGKVSINYAVTLATNYMNKSKKQKIDQEIQEKNDQLESIRAKALAK